MNVLVELENKTPLLRLKVKNKNKDQKEKLIHLADLLVSGALTDLRPGLMFNMRTPQRDRMFII